MFYIVNRLFYKADKENRSTQIFDSQEEAQKRYFNIIAADLQDADITYQMANIISKDGTMLDHQVFDRNTEDEPH